MRVTIEWLSKYRHYCAEIKLLEDEIAGIGQAEAIRYDRVQVQSMPDSTLDETVIKRMNLKALLKRRVAIANEQRLLMELYFETVKDPEIRNMMNLRFVKGFTWSKIARIVSLEESSARKKVTNYIRRSY